MWNCQNLYNALPLELRLDDVDKVLSCDTTVEFKVKQKIDMIPKTIKIWICLNTTYDPNISLPLPPLRLTLKAPTVSNTIASCCASSFTCKEVPRKEKNNK